MSGNHKTPLHGLVILNSVDKVKTGATRSIRLAVEPLKKQDITLHFATARSVYHFGRYFLKENRLKYDFIIFNSLGSISARNHFWYPLWLFAKALKLPTFIYWHETDWALNRQTKAHPKNARRLKQMATHSLVTHLTASNACSQSVQKCYPHIKPHVIYECAVEPEAYKEDSLPALPPTVINIASIQPRKGTDLFVETAIKVCQKHPTVKFIWLGNGKPFGNWAEAIKKTNLQERICFPGYVKAPHTYLQQASLLFLSSRDDPFPLAVLEAMSMGRSVISFNIGGAPEALAGQGTLIPPFDTALAAQEILLFLNQPPQRMTNLALRQRYLELYSPEKLALRLNDIIRKRLSQ